MDEKKFNEQLSFIEKMAEIEWSEIDAELFEEDLEQLYITLYEIRKQLSVVIAEVDMLFLKRFARALQILEDTQDDLITDVQEELEQYFLFENIREKIEEERNISWDELLE